MTYQTIDPNTGKVVKTFEEMNDKALEAAIETADKCYSAWRQTSFADRAMIAKKAAQSMRDNADELARL